MPMTFTDRMVAIRSEMAGLDKSGTVEEQRERLAIYVEENVGDYVEAWEIRSGRPWTDMTSDEAAELLHKYPRLKGNPGVLSRLM